MFHPQLRGRAGPGTSKGEEGGLQEDGDTNVRHAMQRQRDAETVGHRGDLEQTGPVSSPPAFHAQPTLFVVISGDSSLSGPSPPSKSF